MSDILTDRAGIKEYFETIKNRAMREYSLASEARKKGLDPEKKVEVNLASGISQRVEVLLGLPGVAEEYERVYGEVGDKFKTSVIIMEKIACGEIGGIKDREERLEKALKAALLIYTDAVVVAPIEGITKLKIEKNNDGSEYVSIHFAGPIRSAGGTAAALAMVLADLLRKREGLDVWKPTEKEKARWVEEVLIYFKVHSRQYRPSRQELEIVFDNIPVKPDGDPTENFEVSANRDVPGVPSNRVRGGLAISIGESLLLKAKKIAKIAKSLDLNWDWVLDAVKAHKEDLGGAQTSAPYLEGLVAGRPVLSYPGRFGGFRLRYGRSRNTGVMASGIHPATMIFLDSFIATGTQLKREYPGKAMGTVPVDSIEGPIVLLRDGSVVKVRTVEEAERLKDSVEKILFLGDVLVAYGDFRKSGEKLKPPGYCEEWWWEEVKDKGVKRNPDPYEAVKYAVELKIPLHPEYIHFYTALSEDEVRELILAVKEARVEGEEGRMRAYFDSRFKQLFEKICIPHKYDGNVVLEEPYVYPFLVTFGFYEPRALQIFEGAEGSLLEKLSAISGMEIRDKAGCFIGVRMARPEAAKPRKMQPPPHVLFPVGAEGGLQRLVTSAVNPLVEFACFYCPRCDKIVPFPSCPYCGTTTIKQNKCPSCGRMAKEDICRSCGSRMLPYVKANMNVRELLRIAAANLGERVPDQVKGVRGTTNPYRIPERLEKGLLRAKYGVFVFKDGTIRVDMTNLPLTHFKPSEIGTSIDKLRELGYDVNSEDEVVEMYPQDVIISEKVADYLVNVCKFLDDLLEKFYKLPRYYNVEKKEDLIGHLTIWLAPHTSAGIVGRIIGFTKAHVHFEHPYFMLARRRNADGDEDAMMMLLDAFLNFSERYLPEKRGGKMDAPLVVSLTLNPKEVDDEVFEMEYTGSYPLELYLAALEGKDPYSVNIPVIGDIVGTERQFTEIRYSHGTTRFDAGPEHTKYSKMKNMIEKIITQLELQAKICAVDNVDAAERVLSYHFLKDIMGNARAFGRQEFRCSGCNAKYRRIPLKGVCTRCGGNIILTVSRGSVEKYIDVSKEVLERYGLSEYTRQRLFLLENEIKSIFESDGKVQKTISDFFA